MRNEFKNPPKIKSFENTNHYDQMIVQAGIPFMANCEHHHIGFFGIAHVGYIPDGKLIGLSKMPRIVEHHLNPTVYSLQERETKDIADMMEKELENARGVIVVLEALHSCLCYRGVKKPSITITCELRGGFQEQKVKEEFFEHIRLHRMQRPF